MGDLIVVSAVLIIVLLIMNKIRLDKKNGNTCGAGCGNCPASRTCHKLLEEKK